MNRYSLLLKNRTHVWVTITKTVQQGGLNIKILYGKLHTLNSLITTAKIM